MGTNQPIFRDLNPDDPDPEATVIDSLCMNCHASGMTRLLLTKIPFYKEVILMSFSCDECGFQNNEIQSGSQIGEKGVRFTLNVKEPSDLNRQVVRSDYTSVKILEVDFEIPAKSQKGGYMTVEGIIDRSVNGLEQDQVLRRVQHPEAAQQIDDFVEKLKDLKSQNFTLILEDISGNSFIQNPNAPQGDPNCTMVYFNRTTQQDHDVGIFTQQELTGNKESSILHPIAEGEFSYEDFQGEVLQFPTNCSNCGSPCETNMKMTDIPHFKQVVIMATCCEVCGIRTNEVKSGGGIEPKGVEIEIDVRTRDDFSRDVLKSETCDLKIPQLELEVGPHALGGRFTTVEGLITAMRDQLCDPKRSQMFGDSSDEKSKKKFEEFFKKFEDVLEGRLSVTLILNDPAGNSYVQSMRDDDKPDEGMRISRFERNHEQNEELGLNDMKTENYS
ncbi:unnamed protein product [Brassicogethes aeneus]|uniref:Zinc finger protein ZPR1 n=1 Tax=Brassicogethes aeneus TaxID=1431903 RepID=A0A9P0AWK7_BRAAE|nr:unnamed protein product [Brassicogethes aeneus]